ncbi:hypothetical protein JL720_1518 [Aureococcus anophagefferens]|nr:hypothetical protein JL720_1518 [Aureococcus anophagefferens]
MKFGVRLMKEMVQEWKDEYVDYFGLKRRLDAVVAETPAGRPRADSPEPGADEDESPLLVELRPLETGDDFEREVELRSLGRQRVVGLATSASFRASAAAPGAAQKAFYAALDADVARVEAFYLRMLQDLDVRVARRRARRRLGVAEELMQVHLLCALLSSFCELNATAVAKIAKKHDKLLGVAWKGAYTSAAERCSFWRSGPATVAALRSEVEATYAQLFTEGHLSAARAALRDGAGDYALRRPSRGADTFVAGALVGVAACASASLLVARQHLESPVETLDDVGWAFVRLASLPALHVLGFAVDILAWQETSVNWVNVFAMLPARAAETLEWPFLARMTSGVLASALVALLGVVLNVRRAYLAATVLVLLASGSLLSRRGLRFLASECPYLTRVLRANAAAPCGGSVGFEHTFVADQFCSQTRVLGDLGLLACVAARGGGRGAAAEHFARFGLAVAPYWVRFWQCARRRCGPENHGPSQYNAAKYFVSVMAMTAALTCHGPRRPLFVVGATCSTLFSYYWDLVHDWGVFGGRGAWRLRERRDVPPRYLRAACVLDLAFRLLWVANTGVEASGTLASGTHETLFAAACVEINQGNALTVSKRSILASKSAAAAERAPAASSDSDTDARDSTSSESVLSDAGERAAVRGLGRVGGAGRRRGPRARSAA